MDLIQKTREFLANEKIDYLLVNATNEFLVEYCNLNENSRYFLTNFSGSTGDAVISKKDLLLFVDGRYHEQADLEVDDKVVTVVKMKMHESFVERLAKKLKSNATLAIVAKKNSQGRYEVLKGNLDKKNIKIKLLDFDPVMKFVDNKVTTKKSKIECVSDEISGLSADKKFKKVAATIKKYEAILNTNLEEVSYLCNLRDFSVNYSSKIEAKCLITKDVAVLFSDDKIEKFSDKFKIQKLGEFESYIKNLKNIDKFYVDKISINAYDYRLLEDKAAFMSENLLKDMKSVKTKAEIEHYKSCFERTDKALMATREFILNTDNISEFDIAKKLEENFYRYGAKSLSFKSIVAKGKNSALAHYSKNSKEEILDDKNWILIDCGAYYEGGYATDITRVFIKGEPTELQKTVYTTVLRGFLAAFNKKITSKTSGSKIDKAARDVLSVEAPKGFAFSHAIGHGIGINVHESPPSLGLASSSSTPLKANMCFTIEPGLYKKGYGGVRLENSCYLEEIDSKFVIKSFTNMCFEKKLIDFDLLSKKEQKWLSAFELR